MTSLLKNGKLCCGGTSPGRGGGVGFFPYAVGTAGNGALPGGAHCGFFLTPLERQGTLACPAGAPFLGKKWGKEPQREEVLPSGLPSLVGLCGGEAVLLTEYLACGPHTGRPVTARPPAGRAGDVDRYPLGKGGEKQFRFPLVPPVNKPLLPPAQAGGRAMRRWSWRPQARPQPDRTTFPRSSHQRMGFQGEGTSFPLVFFPLFLQRNRAPPGQGTVPARSNGVGEEPHTAPIPTAMGFKALQSAPSARPAAPPGAPAAPLPHGGTGFPSHSPRQCPRRRRQPPRGRSPGTPSPPR